MYERDEVPADDDVSDVAGLDAQEDGATTKATSKLQGFIGAVNITDQLDESVRNKIGAQVLRGYEIDNASRAEWVRLIKTAMDLATQKKEDKSWPWPKAANIKYPLITTAAIQFNARAYPAIVKGADVVKGAVNGPDPDGSKKTRADRIGRHMSYQLLNQVPAWEEELDHLLIELPIVGCMFRKTYYDRGMGSNKSDLVSAMNLVFNHTVPFNKLRRLTHEIPLYKNDVIERVRSGTWRDIIDKLGTPIGDTEDEDPAYDFLEQHCWYDLDEDGYKEPYIVTVVKESGEVARIMPNYDEESIFINDRGQVGRIKETAYFTKFGFMPNPDGGSYDWGLGVLLNPINEAINTAFNQMFDAGTLQNVGGGLIGNGLRLKGGPITMAPGQFTPVDSSGGPIRDNIYHMDHRGPNAVMFQLVGMLLEAGKDISSVKDILTGEQQVNQTATTTLALIEQGQKVFSAIYKRVHRSLKAEFQKLFELNKKYMNPKEYFQYQDKSEPIYLEDYQGDSTDVSPVSDPNLVSDAQNLTQAEALMRFLGDPLIDQKEIRLRYLTAIKVENPESLLQDQQPPPEDPQLLKIKADIEAQKVEVTAMAEKMVAEMDNLAAKTADLEASTILKIAQAEAVQIGPQMDLYMMQFQAMLDRHTNAVQAQQQPQGEMSDDQGRVSGVEAPPVDQAVSPVPEGLPPTTGGEMGEGGIM